MRRSEEDRNSCEGFVKEKRKSQESDSPLTKMNGLTNPLTRELENKPKVRQKLSRNRIRRYEQLLKCFGQLE
jgi:hypothetical protein